MCLCQYFWDLFVSEAEMYTLIFFYVEIASQSREFNQKKKLYEPKF